MSDPTPVVITILPSQASLGDQLAAVIGARHDQRHVDFESVLGHIADTFRSGAPMVVLAASGIIIRAIAPHLGHKRTEPPVLAVSADGGSIVPLLGGHRGANKLAEKLAVSLDAHAAITTAGDAVFGVALDAPPSGWRLENPLDAKAAMVAILSNFFYTRSVPCELWFLNRTNRGI